MHHFHLREGELYAEDVPLREIADRFGTPCYVYSLATLQRHYRVFDQAFAAIRHLVCFSVKANSNLAVLRTFAREGSGFDIVSGGELFRALQAGADPAKIVFSGVGKSRDEIAAALQAGILMFNVESPAELDVIDRVAGELRGRARVALRVNPDVDPQTHPYIATGLKKSKFGIHIQRSLEDYRRARDLDHTEVVGVDCHIGSQLTTVPPFVDALQRIRDLVEQLHTEQFNIQYVDMGGGLGITYNDEQPPDPQTYAAALTEGLRGLDVTLLLEPGRVIVGNAGIMLTRVVYLKGSDEKNFVVVDAGMNDLIRPALYGSYQAIRPVRRRAAISFTADIVGPVCESGDFLARDRELPLVEAGDLLAVMSAGAYGFVMASNYNARPRPPEVLVNGSTCHLVRQRETWDDLIRGECIPEFLR
jgi:diaminopimelate decarboxylase